MTRLRVHWSRWPLRIRLVAGFSIAMFVVLVAAGTFVYWRVEYALDRGLDTDLTAAAQTIEPLVEARGAVSDRSTAEATGATWQVLAADGRVLDHGSLAGAAPMVGAHQLAEVGAGSRTFDVGNLLPISKNPYRLKISRISTSPALYLLVGVRRDHRDEALRELLAQLSIAGLGALVVTGFVGERLANAALRPVERYRRQAAAIAAGATELRLDVSTDRDDEVTRLGHTFNEMLSSLERALDRERQFVNEASHELRTPITLLGSRIQLARRRPRTAQEHERILAELQVDLERLARLAEQLLQLGSAGRRTDDGASDLAATAARVIDQRRVADPPHAGQLTLSLLEPVLPVRLADFEVERILTNLLDNAAAHGAPPYEVTVDRPVEEWARVTVTDAGPGMPPGLLEGATQRFARSDEARARPGAGLGLALIETVVAAAGGELRLCYDGRHTTHGTPAPVVCDHGPSMLVTVLLPVAPATGSD